MAGSWKRYRRIVVADQAFRWQCIHHDGYTFSSALDRVVVRTEQRAHRRLIVRFAAPGDVIGLITPGRVRGFILHALARGWLREHDVLSMNNPDWFGPENAPA